MFDLAELTNWDEYSKLFIGLFAMASPATVLPQFVGLVDRRSANEQQQIARIGAVSFALVMLLFTFFGHTLLGLFGITIAAFRIAGGLLLLLIGLDMLRAVPGSRRQQSENGSVSALQLGIVPLAVPILAGPGSISTLVVFASLHEALTHKVVVSAVVLMLSVYVYLALRLTIASQRLITPRAAIFFLRIMGLVIVAIGVEFIVDGIAAHFPAVFGPIHH
jgi:multiple antibiotic resistance protein